MPQPRSDAVNSRQDAFQQALALHQRGLASEAEALCEAILRRDPRHVAALHLAGVIALQTRRSERGLAMLGRAISLRPDYAEAHRDLGGGLFACNRLTDALASYERAIALKPGLAEAHYSRAVILSHLDRYEEALACHDAAIALRPEQAIVHSGRAAVLCQLQRYEEALAASARAIELKPDCAEAHSNRGVALTRLARHLEALASHDRATALNPDHADAHASRAVTLGQLCRYEEALVSYDAAIALMPDQAAWHDGRALTLCALQRYEAAIAGHSAAIRLQPDHADAYHHRGVALARQQRYAEALADYDRAIALKPDCAEMHYDRGLAMANLHRHTEALADYERAIVLKPDFVGPHWCMAMGLLALGRFDPGWSLYEWRKRRDPPVANRTFLQPLWLGEMPIAGKTLFIHSEQGLGDTLQFCRYARLARACGARVVMSVREPLRRLLQTLGADIDVIGGNEVPAAFDCHCPMMSLPLACRTTLATIPNETPYLAAEAAAVARWRARLAALGGLCVGLCWAGDPRRDQPAAHATDRRRSTTLARFAPLGCVSGVTFISLQKGEAAAQSATPPAGLSPHDWTDELEDFADTAALIEALDLVITVDTAVAHVAGALGKPVWVLNRFDACWRWLTDRDDSPWYPTARLWRQPEPGDWDSVVAAVAVALRELARHTPGGEVG